MSSIVTIDLTKHPNNVPLGMLLAPGAGGNTTTTSQSSETSFGNYLIKELRDDNTSNNLPTSSNVTLVAGWEHSNNNSTTTRHLGPIQRSGLIRLGDRLVRINGRDVTDWTFREVMDALKELRDDNDSSTTGRRNRIRLKSLGFAPSNTTEWLKGTHTHTTSTSDTNFFGLFNPQHTNSTVNNNNTESISSSHVVHSKRTYSFVSFIGRWRVAYESPSSDTEVEDNDQMRVDSNNNSNTDHSLPPNRQLSENSTSELERQLFKEPTMMVNREDTGQSSSSPPTSLLQEVESKGDATTNEQSTTVATTVERKPYIEYEIQCHIIFRDPNSFFTNRHNTGLNTGLNSHTNNNRDEHHSWSVWKRFSALQTLDEELRYDFGWQMDAFTHDNKDDSRIKEVSSILLSSGEREGIVFPSAHGLESWWYNVRNGGGVVNTLLGESSDIVSDSTGREKESQVANRADRQQQGSGWGSSLYSYFRTASNTSNDKRRNSTETNNSHTSNSNCPIPIPFIERRQKELAFYWSDLMKIEDIFEFSDVQSHKFGKTMAAFLEVDKVLLARKSISGAASLSSSPLHQQHHLSQFPAIHENEPELYGTSLRPSLLAPSERLSTMTPTREVSGLTIHDDDVSLLSDGTGAFDNHHLTSHNSPIRGRPMVDVVPKQYAGENGNLSQSETQEKKVPSSSKSVASTSVASRKNRIKAPRAKPAFQRQILTP